MKKQLSLVMLSLSWVAWLIAVFALPITADSTVKDFSHDSVSNLLQPTQIQFTASPELLEIPEFKVDWTLKSKLNSDWYYDLLSPSGVYLSPSFFNKSLPLFDVKDTFIHFYYTW